MEVVVDGAMVGDDGGGEVGVRDGQAPKTTTCKRQGEHIDMVANTAVSDQNTSDLIALTT